MSNSSHRLMLLLLYFYSAIFLGINVKIFRKITKKYINTQIFEIILTKMIFYKSISLGNLLYHKKIWHFTTNVTNTEILVIQEGNYFSGVKTNNQTNQSNLLWNNTLYNDTGYNEENTFTVLDDETYSFLGKIYLVNESGLEVYGIKCDDFSLVSLGEAGIMSCLKNEKINFVFPNKEFRELTIISCEKNENILRLYEVIENGNIYLRSISHKYDTAKFNFICEPEYQVEFLESKLSNKTSIVVKSDISVELYRFPKYEKLYMTKNFNKTSKLIFGEFAKSPFHDVLNIQKKEISLNRYNPDTKMYEFLSKKTFKTDSRSNNIFYMTIEKNRNSLDKLTLINCNENKVYKYLQKDNIWNVFEIDYKKNANISISKPTIFEMKNKLTVMEYFDKKYFVTKLQINKENVNKLFRRHENPKDNEDKSSPKEDLPEMVDWLLESSINPDEYFYKIVVENISEARSFADYFSLLVERTSKFLSGNKIDFFPNMVLGPVLNFQRNEYKIFYKIIDLKKFIAIKIYIIMEYENQTKFIFRSFINLGSETDNPFEPVKKERDSEDYPFEEIPINDFVTKKQKIQEYHEVCGQNENYNIKNVKSEINIQCVPKNKKNKHNLISPKKAKIKIDNIVNKMQFSSEEIEIFKSKFNQNDNILVDAESYFAIFSKELFVKSYDLEEITKNKSGCDFKNDCDILSRSDNDDHLTSDIDTNFGDFIDHLLKIENHQDKSPKDDQENPSKDDLEDILYSLETSFEDFVQLLLKSYKSIEINKKSSESGFHGFLYGILCINYSNNYELDIFTEVSTGKGYADIIFLSKKSYTNRKNNLNYWPIIIELKDDKNSNDEKAICQVLRKRYYCNVFLKTLATNSLIVGIDSRNNFVSVIRKEIPKVQSFFDIIYNLSSDLDKSDFGKSDFDKQLINLYFLMHPCSFKSKDITYFSKMLLGMIVSEVKFRDIYLFTQNTQQFTTLLFKIEEKNTWFLLDINESPNNDVGAANRNSGARQNIGRLPLPKTEKIIKIVLSINSRSKKYCEENNDIENFKEFELKNFDSRIEFDFKRKDSKGFYEKLEKAPIFELSKIMKEFNGPIENDSLDKNLDFNLKEIKNNIKSESDFHGFIHGMFLTIYDNNLNSKIFYRISTESNPSNGSRIDLLVKKHIKTDLGFKVSNLWLIDIKFMELQKKDHQETIQQINRYSKNIGSLTDSRTYKCIGIFFYKKKKLIRIMNFGDYNVGKTYKEFKEGKFFINKLLLS